MGQCLSAIWQCRGTVINLEGLAPAPEPWGSSATSLKGHELAAECCLRDACRNGDWRGWRRPVERGRRDRDWRRRCGSRARAGRGPPLCHGHADGRQQPKWRDRGQQRGRQQRQPQLRRLWRLQLLHACLSRPWAGPQVALRAERLSCLLLSCLVSPLRPKVLGIISSSCISQEDCIGCECVYLGYRFLAPHGCLPGVRGNAQRLVGVDMH